MDKKGFKEMSFYTVHKLYMAATHMCVSTGRVRKGIEAIIETECSFVGQIVKSLIPFPDKQVSKTM